MIAARLLLLVLVATEAMLSPAPGLRSFVRHALANELGLRSARLTASLADGRLGVARSRYHPKVLPLYSVSGSEDSRTEAQGMEISWITGFGFDLRAGASRQHTRYSGGAPDVDFDTRFIETTVPLGRSFGRLPAQVDLDAARTEAEESQRNLEDLQQITILAIVGDYYGYLRASKELIVAREALARAEYNFEIADMKYDLGEISRVDLDRSQQLVQQSALAAMSAENTLTRLRNDIVSSYQIKDIDSYRLTIAEPERFRFELGLEDAVARACSVDTRLLNAQDRLRLRQDQLRLARRRLWPDLNLTYRLSRHRDRIGSDWSEPENDQVFLVSTDLSLDYAARRYGYLSAKVYRERASLEIERILQDLRATVSSELETLARNRQLLRISEQSLVTAHSQLEVASMRFERGIGSSFDVVEAQGQLHSAELALLNAQVSFIINYYRLLYRLRLLEIERLVE